MQVPLLPKLRGNFAEFLNQSYLTRLRILTLPTCVGLRYGHQQYSLRGFSWKQRINHFRTLRSTSSVLSVNESPDLPKDSAYNLEPGQPTPGWPTFLRHPFTQTHIWRYRNIDLFAIAYAFRPQLRCRLTLSRRALLRKPWAFGEGDSHPLFRYSCQHTLFQDLHRTSRCDFTGYWNAPLPLYQKIESAASVICLAPLNFRRGPTRPVSCYAFFKGWLLLSQPPGCLSVPTTFPT